MIAYAYAVDQYGSQPTGSGVGTDSQTLAEVVICASSERLFPSMSLEKWRAALVAINFELPLRCSAPGWDGEGAAPLSETSRIDALSALTMLFRAGVPAPEVMVDADGELAIEWATPSRSVIFTFQENGSLSHTALYDGAQDQPGTVVFSDAIPEELLQKIQRVYAIAAL